MNKSALDQHPKQDHYTSTDIIGKGKFGSVLRCRRSDCEDGLYNLALKVTERAGIRNGMCYESETKALELVKGVKFMMQMTDFYDNTLHFYIVSEYIPGPTLFRINWQNQVDRVYLSAAAVKFFLIEMVLMVEALTMRRLIHCDIKPSNIVMDKNGHLVLIDFGLCLFPEKDFDRIRDVKRGTPPFMSPEALGYAHFDHSVDWWAMAVTTVKTATFQMPYRSLTATPTVTSVHQSIRSAEMPSIEKLNKEPLPEPFVSLMQSMLQKRREARLGSLGSSSQIMMHTYFANVDWQAFSDQQIEPPFVITEKTEQNTLGIENNPIFDELL